jgi:transposase
MLGTFVREGAMANRRISMRKLRQALRLAWEAGLGLRPIGHSLGLSPTTVGEYLRRAEIAGLTWPLPAEIDDATLEARLFPGASPLPPQERPLPDFASVHRELRRKGVTLALLWQEYKATHAEGLQYSQFCEHYRRFVGRLDLVMRQHHRAGEKGFIDYAGQTVPVVDSSTGEVREAQVFVATLGASNYTYAEATWTQALPDWIASHIRAFEYFGAVPALLVPDNLKSAVARACRYEPEPNATYQELASHYGTAILPARVRRPRDKAKVEAGVQLVERWILARLRHQSFLSLPELNAAIRTLLEELNTRPFKKLPGSRRTLFETLDKPAMRPLPPERYVLAEWRIARVHIDYHVEADGHYYSVPYTLVKQRVEVRLTATTVEVLHRGQRVASHLRSSARGRHTTLPEHMPKAHAAHAEWTPERLVRWAAECGPAAAALVETILTTRRHPEQGFRACLGVMRLGKEYGAERLEAACARALAIAAPSFRSVHSILRHGLDRRPAPGEDATGSLPTAHENIRGADYYH